MAGNYPDVPGNRLEVDRDGTIGALISSAGVITPLTSTQLQSLNDESDSTTIPTPGSNGFTAYIFPQPRELQAIFFSHSSGNATVSVSSNTTNGYDGTWTVVLTAAARTLATMPNYRSGIETITASNVKGIRVLSSTSGAPRTFHVYGRASAANPDKLEFWHPTLDQPLHQTPAALDYGNIARGASVDITLRIKNLSSSLTANSITISLEALTDAASPTMLSGMTLSYNGGAFAATASIPSLTPGSTSSGLLTVRNAPPSTVTVGAWSQRIVASAASWT